MTRFDVCNIYLAQFPDSRFLEIGTKAGRGARNVRAVIKVGVDPFPEFAWTEYTSTYRMTSDDFFHLTQGIQDFHAVLIDGLHHSNQVLRDVENSLNHLHPRGVIVVHDCNPVDERSQRTPRRKGQNHWNGDCWKAIVQLRSTRSDLQVVTLDVDEGLGIITRTEITRTLVQTSSELTWNALEEQREKLLGLVKM